MQLWDELNQQQSLPVLIIGAANRPQDLDPAIQRRFERSLLIGLPNESERVAILKKLLGAIEKEKGFDFLAAAKLTEGYCSSDLLNVCKAAITIPLTEKKRWKLQQSQEASATNSSSSSSPVSVTLRPLKLEVRKDLV